MHELYYLKAIAESFLLPAGFESRTEELRPDAFGSYYCVYDRQGEQLRFVWDGRDGWGFLEHRREGDEQWAPVGATIPEGPIDSMKEQATREWGSALAELL